MGRLSELPNIGKVAEAKLIDVGIDSPELLKKTGSKAAFIKIKLMDSTACYNMLCGLEGAIRGTRWHNLADHVKAELREFYKKL